ncbi:33380_t:CDS:2, partial [Gigaspora margarita]
MQEPINTNIVVLCDGTLNFPAIETNVYKLNLLLLSSYNTTRGFNESDLITWFKGLDKINNNYHKAQT